MSPLPTGHGYQSSHSPSTPASTFTKLTSVPTTVWAGEPGLPICEVPLREKLISWNGLDFRKMATHVE